MFKTNLKRKDKKLNKLVGGIRNLAKEKVQIGHFESQGMHYSGYTYPQLMALQHNPIANGFNFPPRPVLDILFFRNERLDAPEINTILKKYSQGGPTPSNNKMLLDNLGKFLRRKEKEIFGSSVLPPNAPMTIKKKGRNSPLIDTRQLLNKVAYKTSVDKTVKEE